MFAVILIGVNAVYFVSVKRSEESTVSDEASNEIAEESVANWVAFAPKIESSQLSDPRRFGMHSDPPPFDAFDTVDGQQVSRFAMLAGACRLQDYAIRNRNDSSEWMPERLFARRLSGEEQECLRQNLPDGYQLSKLISPTKPSQISWSEDLTNLISSESANAQAH